ncbi:MAG: helix-turn-helix domain-containing protein [Flavobacteriaceae bacterium]|nr:helix-turn-helix domain-containing protein [Flavobacteriaceae bacterium]
MSKLVEYREKLNLTQEELSEKAELSVRTIQRIEAGAEPKGHTLKVLAKALNITENTLLGIEEIIDGINYKLLKLINTSSLLFVILPPMNIIMPLIIMIFKKQFNPLTKQIVSIQILWLILTAISFIISLAIHFSLSIKDRFTSVMLLFSVVANGYIIIRNTASIDKNNKLHFKLKFNII